MHSRVPAHGARARDSRVARGTVRERLRPGAPVRRLDRPLLAGQPPADLQGAGPDGVRQARRVQPRRPGRPAGQEGLRDHRRRPRRAHDLARDPHPARGPAQRVRGQAPRDAPRRPRRTGRPGARATHRACRPARGYESSAAKFYPDPTALTDEQVGPYLVLRGGMRAEAGAIEWCDEILTHLETR